MEIPPRTSVPPKNKIVGPHVGKWVRRIGIVFMLLSMGMMMGVTQARKFSDGYVCDYIACTGLMGILLVIMGAIFIDADLTVSSINRKEAIANRLRGASTEELAHDLRKHPSWIRHWPTRTVEACLIAIERKPKLVEYMPKSPKNTNLSLAVSANPGVIEYVGKPTAALWHQAVAADWTLLKSCPMNYQTMDMCLNAVRVNPKAVKLIAGRRLKARVRAALKEE